MVKTIFKKVSLIFFCFLILIVLSACSKKTEETEDGTKVTQDRIMTDDVSYIEDGTEVTIKRNKVNKKASVEMIYNIKDEDEYDDFLGEKVTMVPMMFNMACSMLTMSMFDPEGLEKLIEEGELKEGEDPKDEEMKNHLEGYTVEKISIKFIDAESREDIAYCESRMAGNENIKVDIFRDYSDVSSLFDVKIGDFGDN
jgi:hypothetical protein